MKSKDKSKLKALQFIQKYQLGGNYDPYGMVDPYDYANSLVEAQQQQIVQAPLNQLSQQKELTPYQNLTPKSNLLDQAIPFINPAINLGIGISNLFQAGTAKRAQRRYEKAFNKDLERRQEESRVNDYYYVPQQYQKGGTSQQLDLFLDYYNQMEGRDDLVQQQLTDYYNSNNQKLIEDYQNKKNAGFSNLFKGVTGALPLLQKGGEVKKVKGDKWDSMSVDTLRRRLEERRSNKTPDVDRFKPTPTPVINVGSGKSKSKDRFREMQEGGEYDPTQDIYSEQYNFQMQEIPNEVKDEISQVQIEDQIDQSLMDWIFEEPEEYNYDQAVDEEGGYEGKIHPVVEYFKSMGLNPSSVDEGTHNTGSRHYSGNAVDLGLNTTFGGDLTKMYEFKQWYETKGKQMFPGLTLRDETTRPKGQEVWTGAHYHLEY